MRFNQHLAVLGKYILTFIFYPVGILVIRHGSWSICPIPLLVSIIVALLSTIIAIAAFNADIKITILLISAIHITNITTTKDVAVLTGQLFRSTDSTTMHMHLCLSEDVTVGVECAAFTQVVIASTTSEDITVYVAFKKFYTCSTGLINALQRTDAIIRATGLDDTTSDSSNLTTSEEGVTYMTAIHLDVGDIHTTIIDITTTEDTATIIQTVSTAARPSLVVQLLLIVV